MASRVINNLATLAVVAAMITPALAQTTGTGSAPKTGAGSNMPSSPGTQPGAPTQETSPLTGTGAGSTGKAKSGTNMGQSATPAPGAGGTAKPATGMNGGAGAEHVKAVQQALQAKGMDPGPDRRDHGSEDDGGPQGVPEGPEADRERPARRPDPRQAGGPPLTRRGRTAG